MNDHITHKAFSKDHLKVLGITKRELLKAMEINPKTTVDYALPQQWLNKFTDTTGLDYSLVLSTTFYAYPNLKGCSFGFPISGCIEVNQRIDKWVVNRPLIVEEVNEVKEPCREHHCWQCKNTWIAKVRFNDHTNNLSGERSEYCPKCNTKSSCTSPWTDSNGNAWEF